MAYQKTTNRSDRDIDKQFNMVEFNKIFEKNNLNIENKNNSLNSINNCNNNQKPSILLIITCILIFLGIYLLIFNNFIG